MATEPPAVTPTATVTLENTAFHPMRLEIAAGSTVTWVNEDAYSHDVTAEQFHDDANSWELEAALAPGGSITHEFVDPGVYEYYCTIHGRTSMCGAVIVGDVTFSDQLPCEFGDEGY